MIIEDRLLVALTSFSRCRHRPNSCLASVFFVSREAFSSLTFFDSSTILAAAVSDESEDDPVTENVVTNLDMQQGRSMQQNSKGNAENIPTMQF